MSAQIEEEIAYAVSQKLYNDCRQTCQKAGRQCQYKHQLTVGKVSQTPPVQQLKPNFCPFFQFHTHTAKIKNETK
jgi:hypothetical protein